LDAVLGTEKFKIGKENEDEPYKNLDKKTKFLKGRKSKNVSHLPNGMGEAAKAQAILAGGEREVGGMEW
jgi:nitrite reductase (NAD(P)H)